MTAVCVVCVRARACVGDTAVKLLGSSQPKTFLKAMMFGEGICFLV